MPYAQTSDIKIYYEVIDLTSPSCLEPQTIVFHHGIGADPGIWRDWLPLLIDRYKVVVFDMRGYGRSVDANKNISYSLNILTDDVLSVIDAVGAGKVHLVGESIGGTIGLHFAIQHPERINTLTISNGGHVGSSIERVNAWQETIDTKGIKVWSDEFMENRFYPGALSAEKHTWFSSKQESWTREGILNPIRVLVQTNLKDQLKDIECNVLIMHPDQSPFIPVGVSVDLFQHLKKARLQVFSHSKHGLPFSHSSQCAQLLRQFLQEMG